MHSHQISNWSLHSLCAHWTSAGTALPLVVLCHCGGTGDATHSQGGPDAGANLTPVIVLRDSGGSGNSVVADSASAETSSSDGARDDGGSDAPSDVLGEAAMANEGGRGDEAGDDGAAEDGAGGDAEGSSASGDATVDAGTPCNTSATPKDAACVLNPAYGAFVAMPSLDGDTPMDAGGADAASDGGDAAPSATVEGSPARPFRSIADALAHLGNRSRIYICDGTYFEKVTLTTPVSVFGGLSCTGGVWRWDGGSTQVVSPTPDYALSVTGLNTALIDVQDLTFTVPDATVPGASSVAAIIATSSVTLTRVMLTAGRGANGADGAAGTPNYVPPDARAAFVPYWAQVTCTNGDSSLGGAGGHYDGIYNPYSAPNGASGTASPMPPIVAAGFDGAGGVFDLSALTGAPGDPGAEGVPGLGGGAAKVLGTLSAMSWVPTKGSDGQTGSPGQGGGGGGSFECPSNSLSYPGGGGGGGGCGGAGGLGGLGGGASIALMSINSSVTVISSTLTPSEGGNGGRGGPGEDGEGGGAASTDPPPLECQCSGTWCVGAGAQGGNGGNGGGGSGGGGGTGGISVGVLYRGVEPVVDVITGIWPGAAGGAGLGGLPGSQILDTVGKPGSAGLAGLTAQFHGPV